ncbi:MAG: glycoside hydrolase [Bacteroidetes bacterium]|nr:glycoside hydrolase [Bacteroidota bacterium]
MAGLNIHKISLFLLLLIAKAALAQMDVPVFGHINVLNGYQKEISGENINYYSALPDVANSALLTRCIDSSYAIEWETEPVPSRVKGKFLYFGWVAAYSTKTSTGNRNFDLYINGNKVITFTTLKDLDTAFWSQRGRNGEELVFERIRTDAVGDAHGFMYLKMPSSSLRKGKPLKLKVIGEPSGSRDWYMTFKYAPTESLSFTPQSLLTIDNKQPVQLLSTYFGSEAILHIKTENGIDSTFTVRKGENTFSILLPAVIRPTTLQMKARLNKEHWHSYPVELKPVIFRQIHLIHHAHYDVGYSNLQEEVEKIHNRNISNALRYIEQTRNLPAEARFKWNIETTFAIDNFLKVASPNEKLRLFKAIKDGSIGVGSLYANILTGLCQPDELLKITGFARRLEKENGIVLPAVMMSDIPGLTWSAIAALAESGIRYFSDGPNYTGSIPYGGDRVGNSNNHWVDKPFWWITPSGDKKILFWMAGKGYSSWHGFKAGEINSDKGRNRIASYMAELDAEGYPYEMVQWRYNIVSDNGPTDSLVSNFIFDWNNKYKSPKIILNTVENMFREFEKRYGDNLPEFKGDMTPYWEDGAYSTTRETALNHDNSCKLTALGTLFSLADPSAYDPEIFDLSWKSVLLWDEHTWGAYNSISDPDIPFVTEQWRFKQQYALRADSLVRVLGESLRRNAGHEQVLKFDVYNTLSWDRKDIIYLSPDQAKGAGSVRDESGKLLPFQRLADGRVAIELEVPALDFTQLTLILDSTMRNAHPFVLPTGRIRNDHTQLQINKSTGSIASIICKPGNIQLIDTSHYSGANEYLYVPGRDPSKAKAVSEILSISQESGPVLNSIEIRSLAPGSHSLDSEIRLFKDIDRIEITNTIDKIAIRDKESVHFVFPFSLRQAKQRFNTGWGGIFEPGINQLEGSNQDFYSVQQWCDISNSKQGVSLLLKESCLVEPGSMLDERTGKYGVKSWKVKADTTPTIISYVMNNYWHTNYKADQEGTVSMNYALVPHAEFDQPVVQKQGMEYNQPLIVLPAAKEHAKGALFTMDQPSIVITSILPQGTGFELELFNISDAPCAGKFQWKRFQPTGMEILKPDRSEEKIDPKAVLLFPAYGIKKVKIW